MLGAEQYKEILKFAVKCEIDANEYYLAIAKKAKDASVKQLFTELAADEVGHRNSLEAYLKTDGKPLEFEKAIDYKVSETVQKPVVTNDMKFVDAVALAMKNEQEAMDMYNAMAAASCAEQKKMFESLAEMEKGHKNNLEGIYNNAAFVEVW